MGSPVLITGAGRRIGLQLARTLRERGTEPLVHYHTRTDDVDQLEQSGVEVIQGEFDHREGIVTFVETVKDSVEELGGIIHNASIYQETDGSIQQAAEQFSDFFHLHMMAPFLINEHLEDRLKASHRDPADIIMMTDMYAERPVPRVDTYCATKAGLKSLVESGAQKYGPEIKVNGIAPGPVLFEEDADEAYVDKVLDKTPLAREGGADSISEAVLMIFDNEFITGAQIPVDGGRRLT